LYLRDTLRLPAKGLRPSALPFPQLLGRGIQAKKEGRKVRPSFGVTDDVGMLLLPDQHLAHGFLIARLHLVGDVPPAIVLGGNPAVFPHAAPKAGVQDQPL